MRFSSSRIAGAVAVVVAVLAGVVAFRIDPDDVTRVSPAVTGIWVPVATTGEVVQIEGSQGEVVARAPVADAGARLEVAERDDGVVVVDRTAGRVSLVDPAFQEVAGERELVGAPMGDGPLDIGSTRLAAAAGDEVASVEVGLGSADRARLGGPIRSLAVDGAAVFAEDGDRAWRIEAGETEDIGPSNGRFVRVGDDTVVLTSDSIRSLDGDGLACLQQPLDGPDHVIGSDDGLVVIVDGATVQMADIVTGECDVARVGGGAGALGRPAIGLDRVFVPEPGAGRIHVIAWGSDEVVVLAVPRVEGVPDLRVRSRDDLVVAYDGNFPIAAVLDRTRIRVLVDLSPGDQAFRVAVEDGQDDAGLNPVAVESAVEEPAGPIDPAALAALRNADDESEAPAGNELVANFAFSAATVPVGVDVRFVDDSNGEPESWRWDFGDGSVADGPEVRKSWDVPGTYLVTLVVTRGAEESSVSLPILVVPSDVAPPPAADFVASTTVARVGAPVVFEDRSDGDIDRWRWDFGDGASASGRSVSHAWSQPGRYVVRLTVAGDQGVDDTALEITVTERLRAPVPVIDVSSTTPTAGAAVRFAVRSSTDPARFRWDFGDGATSTGASVTHVYPDPGTYTVVLTAENGAGTAQETVEIEVREAVVRPDAVIAALPPLVEVGEEVTLNSLSTNRPDTERWDLGDGSTATGRSIVHSWDSAGTYTVRLTASNDAGSDSATAEVEVLSVLPPPVARIGSYDPSPWVGTDTVFIDDSLHATEFLWDFGDGVTATAPVPAHAFSTPGPKTVTLTVTNRKGSDSTTVTVDPRLRPVADFSVSTTGAQVGEAVTFTDRSLNAVSWRWSFGDGTTSTTRNPTHVYDAAGTFPVTLTVTTGAGDADTSDAVTIAVDPAPPRLAAVVRVPDTGGPVVAGTSVTFEARPTASSGRIDRYQFDFDDGGPVMVESGQASHTFSSSGTYTVRARARGPLGEWSPWVSTTTVVVNPTPPDITSLGVSPSPTTVGVPTGFSASASGAVASWAWDFTGGGTNYAPGSSTASYAFPAAGTYTVWVRATGPGPTFYTDTRSVTVVVRPAPSPITPTASPGTTVITGTAVTFSSADAAGRLGLTWSWSVNGPVQAGYPGVGPTVTHTFAVPGTYTVTVTATDDLGVAVSRSVTVTVSDPVPAVDAAFTSAVAGLGVTFTDLSTGPVRSWMWNFGDGGTSTAQSPTHTYAAPGSYPVTLTVTGPGSQVDSAVATVSVS